MTELFEKSARTLELPAVLELLAGEAVTREGKERSRALCPMTDADEIARAQAETTAAVGMLMTKGSPSFSGVKPVGAALQRADMGGCLNTRELLDIAAVLCATRRASDYGNDGRQERSCIDHLFFSLHPNKFLEESITNAIVDEDTIADSASTELASIRRHIRAMGSRVRDILQKLLSSNQSKYLQENLITMRSDRYVVPVKAEYKNEIPGLVHDVSSSGGTYFIEPLGVVKANNELRELLADEKKEIERILAELSAAVAARKDEIEESYMILVLLDVIFARGNLSVKMRACEPKLSDRFLDLKGARHPLLNPKTAVANDLALGEKYDTLVITGPNTGGKTVTLKTLGLLTLMAQCGLHIPVKDDSTVRVCGKVLADVGDEQSIEQSLSTFSAHMVNIIAILKEADADSLILFDELGAGTDPVEGAALAAAILESSRQAGALVAATTHYAELKVYAMTTPGVENASCEFNVETLAPTYRLLVGIPGKSNAFAISRRLGLPQEVVDRAAARLDAENVRFEDVLSQLEQQRQEMERERQKAAQLRLETENSAKVAREYREKMEEERGRIVEKAQAEARAILQEARDASDLVAQEMKDLRRQQEKGIDWQQVNDRRAEARHLLNETEERLGGQAAPLEAPPAVRDAREGDRVLILGMGTRGEVLSVGRDGTLQIRAGILNITARQDEVRVEDGPDRTAKTRRSASGSRAAPKLTAAARPEVDLRGMTCDEAVAALEQYLDGAAMSKLGTVTVIHGKGTGAVRSAVQQYLKHSRYVKSYRLGRYGEGDNGVTIVELK